VGVFARCASFGPLFLSGVNIDLAAPSLFVFSLLSFGLDSSAINPPDCVQVEAVWPRLGHASTNVCCVRFLRTNRAARDTRCGDCVDHVSVSVVQRADRDGSTLTEGFKRDLSRRERYGGRLAQRRCCAGARRTGWARPVEMGGVPSGLTGRASAFTLDQYVAIPLRFSMYGWLSSGQLKSTP